MKNLKVLIFVSMFLLVASSTWGQKLSGRWQANRGYFYPHIGFIRNEMKESWIEFSEDSITSSLGFYFPIVKYEDDTTYFKYKYVYYGDTERYWINGDSLYIHLESKYGPLKYKILFLDTEQFKLVSAHYGETCFRKISKPKEHHYEISSIHVHVGLTDFSPEYKLEISPDFLLFEDITNLPGKLEKYDMPDGLFHKLCQRFSELNLSAIRSEYKYISSHSKSVEIRLSMLNGNTKVTQLSGGNAGPELFWYACIPVIYSYHLLKYKDVKPIE